MSLDYYEEPKRTAAQRKAWKNTPHLDAPVTDYDLERREMTKKKWRAMLEKGKEKKKDRMTDNKSLVDRSLYDDLPKPKADDYNTKGRPCPYRANVTVFIDKTGLVDKYGNVKYYPDGSIRETWTGEVEDTRIDEINRRKKLKKKNPMVNYDAKPTRIDPTPDGKPRYDKDGNMTHFADGSSRAPWGKTKDGKWHQNKPKSWDKPTNLCQPS